MFHLTTAVISLVKIRITEQLHRTVWECHVQQKRLRRTSVFFPGISEMANYRQAACFTTGAVSCCALRLETGKLQQILGHGVPTSSSLLRGRKGRRKNESFAFYQRSPPFCSAPMERAPRGSGGAEVVAFSDQLKLPGGFLGG